jgi:alkanesulfonate monooxygenase SsuD/methylene tetrahydromethanopterin reductase-like flavin-dependent oxidoreductase (luciferase family)
MEIGVILPIEDIFEDVGSLPSYTQIRTLALQAESLGFHSVWVGDHLLFRPSEMTPYITETRGAWESWTILAALAEATSRIRFGPWVLATPLRNPAVLAKMAATMDEVSGGRFILGLGSGWNRPTFDAFGVPFDHLASRFEDALQIIVPLLREGQVDFHGAYYSAPDCAIVPKGPSKNGPPILIAAQHRRMQRLAARYADSWNLPSGYRTLPTTRADLLAGMDEACEDVGRDPATLEITVRMNACFPEAGHIPSLIARAPHFSGSEAVAEALKAYQILGVSLAFCEVYPTTASAFDRLAEAWHAAQADRPL